MSSSAEDRVAIQELIALHGHHFDDCHLDRLHELFTEDVVYDLEDFGVVNLTALWRFARPRRSWASTIRSDTTPQTSSSRSSASTLRMSARAACFFGADPSRRSPLTPRGHESCKACSTPSTGRTVPHGLITPSR